MDIEHVITDYAWAEDSRPELRISGEMNSFILKIPATGAELIFDTADDLEDLVSVLEGYRDIFDTAVEFVRERK